MMTILVSLLLLNLLHGVLSILPISMYTKRVMTGLPKMPNQDHLLMANLEEYKYKTMFVTQRIDNFGHGSDDTYQMKVLYQDENWVPGGPILIYAGNEGKIELFVQNSGYLWDLAPQLKGLVIFAEHRYYGESMPYGKDSYKSREKLAYFTADQAMADYAMLIRHIKTTWSGAENSKVIVFGGSYGGMLASWMRMKYPDVFDGAIASSAPIWSFTWPCDSYARVTTQDYVKYGSENCRKNIRNSWEAFNELGKTPEGQKQLAEIFKACNETITDIKAMKAYAENAFSTSAMVNYPYPAGFLAPLPAWPIREMCKQSGLNDQLFVDSVSLLTAIFEATNIWYNYTGTAGKCNQIGGNEPEGLDGNGWEFQTCTEMTIPFCNTGIDDMFEPSPWSDDDWADTCAKKWFGVRPNLNWTEVSYWGKRIEAASNILFSNGLLDPWSAGGVMKSISPYQPIVIIPDGAHHLELRAANPDDTPACKAARQLETSWILRWINDIPTREAVPASHA